MKLNRKYERGQALILIVLAIFGMIGLVALAIDAGNNFSNRRSAQNAADTAALAGALTCAQAVPPQPSCNPPTSPTLIDQVRAIALARADSNKFINVINGDGTFITVTVYTMDNPLAVGCDPANPIPDPSDPSDLEDSAANYILVTIQTRIKPYFAQVIGIPYLDNCVEAIAHVKPGSLEPLYVGNGIVGLKPDGCKTVDISGTAQVELTGGGVFENSNEDCGLTIGGNPTVLIVDGAISMVSPTVPANPTINGHPIIDVAGGIIGGVPHLDYPPPPYLLPNPTCGPESVTNGNIMWPGSYTGSKSFPPGAVDTLKPGVYCIYGEFRLNNKAILTGNGVTIVMMNGGITWNGGAEVHLTAPTIDPFKGLLIYAPMSNSNPMILNGNSVSFLQGTIFVPAAPISYNGTGSIPTSNLSIIGYTVNLGGTNATIINYDAGTSWQAPIPPEVALSR